MKKVSVDDFARDISDNLQFFIDEAHSRNFSARNSKEWFKLFGDYLGLISPDLTLGEDSDD